MPVTGPAGVQLKIALTYICVTHQLRNTCSGSHVFHFGALPRCTWAPAKRHSSPVEVVLTGRGVALLGLIEIPKIPVGHGAID